MNSEYFDLIKNDTILSRLDIKFIDPSSNSDHISALNSTADIQANSYLTDYGHFYRYSEPFWLFQPSTIEEALYGLRRLATLNIRVCCRGSGHSMNGFSLPRNGEILFSTLKLQKVELCHSSYISVDSGVQILQLNRWLQLQNFQLPVVHDGCLAGPTVGGFVCAGGFGQASIKKGGFWNHIKSMLVWFFSSGLRTITPNDNDFWLICGCAKFDGVILSVDLFIEQIDHPLYFNNNNLKLHDSLSFCYESHPRNLWFTFIAPRYCQSLLKQNIVRLHHEFSGYWDSLPPYLYIIKSMNSQCPPSFHSVQDVDLIAAGIWGNVDNVDIFKHIDKLLFKINQVSCKYSTLHRYWQSEL